ncbi:MAG TPA: glycosyltransferase [Patescibacteria group bacterium]|nr:glycosyltransferase [Patescibacteria group bacterium]
MKRILFISGSLGLGHISRDLAIAKELRKCRADTDIRWLAAEPARSVIEQAGERVVDEIDLYRNDSAQAEAAAKGTRLNLLKYAYKALLAWLHNADVVKQIIERENYDLIIGDETYEIVVAIILKRLKLKIPFLMLYDFLGLDAMSENPLEKIGAFFWNRIWSLDYKIFARGKNLALFLGELEDIPDNRFGFLLPKRREYARKHYHFVGYILPFAAGDLADKARLRKELGYGDAPLVICSIGGTSIGKNLLELCGKAYSIAKQQIANLHMVLVCGPRLPAESLTVPPEVEVKQFVPDLYRHFAACDLAVVQAGGTTTLELTALQRPFIYFPIEGHSEQEIVVAGRLRRHKAGKAMSYAAGTPDSLAAAIVTNINGHVEYKDIPFNGACRVVQFINTLIKDQPA